VSALRQRVEAHLGSREVARVIYGSIVGLALVLALRDHPPSSGAMAGLLLATAVAIGLAELYAEVVSAEARTRRSVSRAELREMSDEAIAVVFGAGLPAVFFLLAALGVIERQLAFSLSKWSGLGLICGYGFIAARMAGATVARGLWRAAVAGLVAGALIVIKALLH
jgi:hypothetical protein